MAYREKLIELLSKVQDYGTKTTSEEWSVTVETKGNDIIADHLIANGVTLTDSVPRFLVTQKNVSEAELLSLQNSPVIFNAGDADIIPIYPDRWIPVTERLPERDVKVLTFGVYGFSVNYRDRFSGKWRGVNGRPQWITHWMPLPPAPKGE